ncbi:MULTISPECIES: thioesterase II family protein [Streptomyces]|uniref:Linear gramicidin dehydrogenase LgrE n=1 Tax=Streptomyces chartreusis NRRL 3882 TaxID=1079985 RepID=A0A2N9B6H8_STRCX|nr:MULTISPECIES: alpha/beta fold hydrolase [Streptomyces]MYS95518.1 alpha/beta fold hydrolase [Streptomyces sp. SID5464]SOR78924.1 Linear gramicidin dehydrogenase LgrE [Streptomyces chartreusis NRRL 3882]
MASPSDDSDDWTHVLRPSAHRTARIVVFPHAGAGAQRYASVLAGLPETVEVVGVTLPGRERRAGLAPRTTLTAAVTGIRRELCVLAPAPTVFYGHSLGGLLALAVAHTGGHCDGLVVSCSQPGAGSRPRPEHPGPAAELAGIFARHRLPADALRDPSLSPAQQALAQDLALAREALHTVEPLRLTVPVTALAGTEDPLVAPGVLPLWARFTSGPVRCRLAEGGHFFPFTPYGQGVLLEELLASLTAAHPGAPAR